MSIAIYSLGSPYEPLEYVSAEFIPDILRDPGEACSGAPCMVYKAGRGVSSSRKRCGTARNKMTDFINVGHLPLARVYRPAIFTGHSYQYRSLVPG